MSERPESDTQRDKSAQPIRPGDTPPAARTSNNRAFVPRRRAPSLFWPIALIGIGVLLLLSNMGLIPATGWAVLWRLWPIALIALGLDVLIGRRSIAGAIASGVLILVLVGTAIGVTLFAEQIPLLVDLAKAPVVQYEHVEYPLDGIERADIIIDLTSMPSTLYALDDSGNLVEADVAYRGDLIFSTQPAGDHVHVTLDSVQQGFSYGAVSSSADARAKWDVGLSPNAALSLDLDASSGYCDFDLSELTITELFIDAGSGGMTLALPESSSFTGEIDGSSGAITIELPDNVGLKVELEDGSGRFSPGERLNFVSGDTDDHSVWETGGYRSADYKIELFIDQGSGRLTIQ
ncbi:MAG: hypothetical protein J7M39_03755 [Anaerolineae bacterium]|nr:hypothetical protein [Anaerolineae bacterium]